MEAFLSAFTLAYLLAAAVGLAAGAVFRHALGSSDDGRAATERTYKTLGKLTLGVFLPLHLFLTLIKAKGLNDAAYLPVMFGCGVVATFSILGATWLITRVQPFRARYAPHFPYIAATFAGGGRSIFLLWALAQVFAAQLAAQTAALGLRPGVHFDMFAMFDIGYWLLFIAIVHTWLMKRTFSNRPEAAAAYDPAKDTNPLPLVIAVSLGVAIQLIAPVKAWLDLNLGLHWVDIVRSVFAAGMVGLSAMAIALKVQIKSPFGELTNIAFVVFARLVGLTVPIGAGALLFPQYALYILLIGTTFVFSPPSSLIDRMLDGRGASKQETTDAANLNVAWNLVLVVLAGLLAVGALFVGWSPGGD